MDADREVLRQHEQALQRLEELQKGMIGGERAGDEGLRKQLQQRRQRADERLEALRHASSELEDDGIIERIFNSLTGQLCALQDLLRDAIFAEKIHSISNFNHFIARSLYYCEQYYISVSPYTLCRDVNKLG